ncbi:MAG: phenylalanine--tRNA ligase subunit beta, partial [Steroidobacteraceae bacterium]|nr:phenylalanine--tRNA ligase subunit beta [Steroidobacteraceae bacterium]
MKLSMQWLRDWVDCPWDGAELGRRLTMAGFELEALDRAAPAFSQVVVARIDTCEPHPQADKLRVCRVSTGSGPPLQIVCGAANARAGLVTALALPGAVLPGGTEIRAATLRGVSSQGMLCSARELGLDEAAEGIVELPADLPLGQDLRTALALDDEILDIAITPNRGDAMSVLGLAREVAALADRPLRPAPQWPIPAVDDALRLPIELIPGAGCRRFLGRLIRGLRNDGQSPWWLRERLRRAGLRSISPVVDVTNYVLLDLGQPMHAYDAARLVRGITVRRARAGESLTLLDGKAYTLDPEVLVIADGAGPVGLA